MRFQRRKLATALACMTGLGGALTLAATWAAATDISVEVTGSNIKGVLSEGALPVQTITREEITKSGAQTAYEILEHVSAVMSYGGFNEQRSMLGVDKPGFAGISFRGLGYDKALILLNGRRIANFALGTSAPGVDLNAIPTSAIARVEILKDGASAIYGSDAIAGVINFITRQDFAGAEIFGYYASPQEKGGQEARATVTAGYGDLSKDKFNAWLSFDYLDNTRINAADRSFSKTGYLPDLGVDRTQPQSFPANVTIPGGPTRNPTDPTPNAPSTVLSPVCLPPLSFPTNNLPHQCQYDASNRIDILAPSTRYNVLGRLTWQINPQLQMFGEGSYSRNHFIFAAFETQAGIDPATRGPFLLPASSPYYPTAWLQANYPNVVGQSLAVAYRTVEMGRRTQEVTSEQDRAVIGVRGTLHDWDYEAAFNYNRSEVRDWFTDGFLDQRTFYPLFATGVVNPFGPNTPEVQAQMAASEINQEVQHSIGTIASVDFKTSGDIVPLPAGPLKLAFGGEYRKEDLSQWRAPIMESGFIVAAPTVPSVPLKSRTVGALFAEAYIPIAKGLDAQAALRFDHYSDFGSTTNPKLALRWQPSRQLLLRGSWNTGFHAPSLIELYQPVATSVTSSSYIDPLRCPFTQLSTDCLRQIRFQRGGNPALMPETSDQWSFGIVLEPADGLSASVDWFRIDLRNLLAQRSEGFIAATASDPNSPYIVRGPIDPAYPDLPGPIQYFLGATENLGQKSVEGIDVDLTARSGMLSLGRLTAHLNGTYLISYRQSRDDGNFPDIVGTRGELGGSIPRWKHVLTFDWSYGPWNATLIENYIHSYTEACIQSTVSNPRGGDSSGCTTRKVGAYETWDLSAGYTGLKNTTLRLGVKNVLNRDPPLSNQATFFQAGFDPTYADVRGRTFYGSVRYTFR